MPVLAQCGTRSRKGSAWSNCALQTHLPPRVLVLATLHLRTRFCTQWHLSADGSSLLPLSCLQRSVLLVLTRVSGSPPHPALTYTGSHSTLAVAVWLALTNTKQVETGYFTPPWSHWRTSLLTFIFIPPAAANLEVACRGRGFETDGSFLGDKLPWRMAWPRQRWLLLFGGTVWPCLWGPPLKVQLSTWELALTFSCLQWEYQAHGPYCWRKTISKCFNSLQSVFSRYSLSLFL